MPPRSQHIAAVAEQTLERLSGTPVEVLTRDGVMVTIHVGKLYIDQLVALSQFARKLWAAFQQSGGDGVVAEMQAAAARVAQGKEAAEGKEAMDAAVQNVAGGRLITTFLEMLTVEEVGALMSILCDREDAWCERNLGAEDIANVLAAVVEHNDPQVIMVAFRRAARGLKGVLPSSAVPSAQP